MEEIPPLNRWRTISDITRIRIAIFIAVMCIIEVILVMLKVYSCFGSLNWGVVFMPVYLILAVYHIGFYNSFNWHALVAIIITFTMTLNRDRRENVASVLLWMSMIEGFLLFVELSSLYNSLLPNKPVPAGREGNDYCFLYLIFLHKRFILDFCYPERFL